MYKVEMFFFSENDSDGIYNIMQWLSYVPAYINSDLPICEPLDKINRSVSYIPPKEPANPRCMLTGVRNSSNKWETGFFDYGSWTELMSCWAQTVVTGHARLGGIPVGVVVAESRTIELNVPADPANSKSESKVKTFFFSN